MREPFLGLLRAEHAKCFEGDVDNEFSRTSLTFLRAFMGSALRH